MAEDVYAEEYKKFLEDPEKWRAEKAQKERRSRQERRQQERLAWHGPRWSIVYEERPSRFLYVIADADRDEVKVGFSGNVDNRLRTLQSGRPTKLYIYTTEIVDCLRPREAEARAHALLKRHRLRGEWFNCHPEMALTAVRRAVWEAEDGWQGDDA